MTSTGCWLILFLAGAIRVETDPLFRRNWFGKEELVYRFNNCRDLLAMLGLLAPDVSTAGARSLCVAKISRSLTKALTIRMLMCIARSLRSTAESIATPCSVKT
jgi:hypothetical protein